MSDDARRLSNSPAAHGGAGASDAADGRLARRHGPGAARALLDPAAGRAFVVNMDATLAAHVAQAARPR